MSVLHVPNRKQAISCKNSHEIFHVMAHFRWWWLLADSRYIGKISHMHFSWFLKWIHRPIKMSVLVVCTKPKAGGGHKVMMALCSWLPVHRQKYFYLNFTWFLKWKIHMNSIFKCSRDIHMRKFHVRIFSQCTCIACL